MMNFVPLAKLVDAADVERAGDREFTVLSMTRSSGLVPQESVFKKVVASRNLTKYKIVRPNQLVVGIHIDEGALGFSGPDQEGIVSPAYALWDLKDPRIIHVPYLDRFIRSEQAVSYFISKYRETAERRGKLTRDQFLALNVPLPPLPEQKRIAAILDAADALRAKRRESLAQLDTLLQSTFLEMFGDPVTNPMGWEMLTIGNIGILGSGSTPSRKVAENYNGDTPWVKSTEVDWGLIESVSEFVSEVGRKSARLKTYPPDSVVIALYGQGKTRGKCALLGIEATVNQACCVITPSTKCHSLYLFQYLKHSYLRLRSDSRGGNQENLNMGIVRNFPIPLPPLDLQHRFATIVESIEQQKARLRAHLAELDTLFASLQQRAFNGEL